MQDKTKMTINAYNRNQSSYSNMFMNYSSYASHVKEFASLLEENSKVLDIGCGPGNVAKQLWAAKAVNITGIDLSSEMMSLSLAKSARNIFSSSFRSDFYHWGSNCVYRL